MRVDLDVGHRVGDHAAVEGVAFAADPDPQRLQPQPRTYLVSLLTFRQSEADLAHDVVGLEGHRAVVRDRRDVRSNSSSSAMSQDSRRATMISVHTLESSAAPSAAQPVARPAIIGSDDAAGTLTMIYFDERDILAPVHRRGDRGPKCVGTGMKPDFAQHVDVQDRRRREATRRARDDVAQTAAPWEEGLQLAYERIDS